MTEHDAVPDTSMIGLIHRLVHLRYGIPLDTVLNAPLETAQTASTEGLAAELLRMMRAIRTEAIAEDGSRVDYVRLKGSQIFLEFRRCTGLLSHFDPARLPSRAERLAFWINLYNALVLDAVVELDVTHSVNEVPGFFWRAAYNVGGLRYSCFDVEYGILRANRAHPAIPGPHFSGTDPRRRFSLGALDPRVHFALVCAARSCPPISAYEPARIDDQLDLATRAFVNNGGVAIDRDRNAVRLSKIFQWYAPDFGARWLALGDKQPLLAYVRPYLGHKEDQDFVAGRNVQVRFQDYDWRLNLSTL